MEGRRVVLGELVGKQVKRQRLADRKGATRSWSEQGEMDWRVVGSLVAAYLAGSIPFGLLVARWAAGVDIRTRGSGNIGATNVAREVGAGWGALVLLLDFLKGALPTWGLPLLAAGAGTSSLHLQVGCGVAAVLGHMFPCWLRFRGGKGVATGAGVVVVLSPWATLAAVATFALVFASTRIVSASSVTAALVFAVTEMALLWPRPFASETWSLAVFCLLVPTLIVVRHRSNLVRLWRGEEPRMSFSRTKDKKEHSEAGTGSAAEESDEQESSR